MQFQSQLIDQTTAMARVDLVIDELLRIRGEMMRAQFDDGDQDQAS